MFVALDHGVESASDGGPVLPFMLEETASGERDLKRFLTDSLEESVERTRSAASVSDAERVVVCFDGFFTVDGERSDAVFVVGQDRHATVAPTFVQRYRPADAPGGFAAIGNPGYAGADDRLF